MPSSRDDLRPPRLKDMTRACLCEGPADGVVLPIAPTMKNITHDGERYFRMSSWREFDDGAIGALYLWDGWAAKQWPHIFDKPVENDG